MADLGSAGGINQVTGPLGGPLPGGGGHRSTAGFDARLPLLGLFGLLLIGLLLLFARRRRRDT